ncbi:hypothetical protein Pcinc_011177, partial [Petrolisthes cinctipes]
SITGPAFKGFFVQARDKRTDKWVGHFEDAKNTKVYPECSAITHGTVPPKTQVYLNWIAPQDGQTGEVYFTGTVLERYDKYWADMIAKVGTPRNGPLDGPPSSLQRGGGPVRGGRPDFPRGGPPRGGVRPALFQGSRSRPVDISSGFRVRG